MSKKDLLLNAVQELLDGNINKKYPICKNLYEKTNGSYSTEILVEKFSPTWQYFSGDTLYPVSGEAVWCKHLEDREMWWTGEQLELRMSLLEHIKSEVSKLSEEEFEEIFGEY